MNDGFGNPIVIGARYKTVNSTKRETFTVQGAATKILKGVHGDKITLIDLDSEYFRDDVLVTRESSKGVLSIYPFKLFRVPQ